MVLEKLDRYMQNDEIRAPTYIIHKNKFKMNKELKHKIGNHKNTIEIHRQRNLTHMPKQFLHQYHSYANGN